MTKKYKIILSYVVMVSMIFNYLWLPLTVLAQEITESPTPTLEPAPTEDLSPSPTPTLEPTPQPEADPPLAETETPTPTEEPTPTPTEEPQETSTPEPEIDMPAQDEEVKTDTNETVTLALEPTATESAKLEAVDEVVIVIPKELITNIIEINNQTEASANSGQNEASGQEAGIVSGDVLAIANVINMVETSVQSSQIGIFLFDDSVRGQEEITDLDLNQMWKMSTYDSSQMSLVNWLNWFGINQILIGNDVNVLANSGLNFVGETEDAFIMTGDATALVNILNVVGLSAVGSKLFFGIVNINGSSLGNIILPRPELFGYEGSNSLGYQSNVNVVEINNLVESSANSGENVIETGRGEIVTGDALAIANTFNLVNLNTNNGTFYFNLNTTGSLDGLVYNWLVPGQALYLNPFINLFLLGLNSQAVTGSLEGSNLVEINNNVLAMSNTGGNSIDSQGLANIITGKASSIVNINNFVNLNLFNSNWFYGLVNIVGDWKGNIIFAYPDLEIKMGTAVSEVENGDKFSFRIDYKNGGYEDNQNTIIELRLPDEFKYMGDDSGFVAQVNGNKVSWQVGSLKAFETKGFDVWLEADAYGQSALGLVKSAWASFDLEVNTESLIKTKQTETNVNNNYASLKTKIILFENTVSYDNQGKDNFNKNEYENMDNMESEGGVDQRQPVLVIGAKNNVGEFVYPGDIVSFEIEVENKSDVGAYDTLLVHEIYDESGIIQSYNEIFIGEIKAFKKGVVKFGLPIPNSFLTGEYFSATTIYALATNGNEIQSNMAETEFGVKTRYLPVGNDDGQVLAVTDSNDVTDESNNNDDNSFNPRFLAMFLLSSGWIYKRSNKWSRQMTGSIKTGGKRVTDVLLFIFMGFVFVYSLTELGRSMF